QMLLQRIAGEGLVCQLDELLRDRPWRRQELPRREAHDRCQRPDAEEREQSRDAQPDELAPCKTRARVHRMCHGIDRASSQPSAVVIKPPAIATLIIPTTIIAGK